jgi:hypothetical protein
MADNRDIADRRRVIRFHRSLPPFRHGLLVGLWVPKRTMANPTQRIPALVAGKSVRDYHPT